MTDLDDLAAGAAYMRQLHGPAAEPIARLLDAHAADIIRRAGQPPTDLDTAAVAAARALTGRPAAPSTDTPEPT